jgi:mannosyltransferase OCH1-like enzyme
LVSDSNSFQYTNLGIPKIIIKTSWHTQEGGGLPSEIVECLEIHKKLNPDYQLYYFDDKDCEQFMKDYGERELYCYNKLVPGAYKADLFRYCILEKYGGCYSDIGHIQLVPFDEICKDVHMVLVKDMVIKNKKMYRGLYQALLCTVPSHQLFTMLVDKCCENIENEFYGISTLDITGPKFMEKWFNILMFNSSQTDDLIKYYIDKYSDGTIINVLSLRTEISFLGIPLKQKGIFNKDTLIIYTKFDNYNTVMYSNRPRYGDIWHEKNVYKKHYFQHNNKIVITKDSYKYVKEVKKQLLKNVTSLLHNLNIKYVIGHGNLLDFERSDPPIYHDDDIDLRLDIRDINKWISYCNSMVSNIDYKYNIKYDNRIKDTEQQKINGIQLRLLEFKNPFIIEEYNVDVHVDLVFNRVKNKFWKDYDINYNNLRDIEYLGINCTAPSKEDTHKMLSEQYGKKYIIPNYELYTI